MYFRTMLFCFNFLSLLLYIYILALVVILQHYNITLLNSNYNDNDNDNNVMDVNDVAYDSDGSNDTVCASITQSQSPHAHHIQANIAKRSRADASEPATSSLPVTNTDSKQEYEEENDNDDDDNQSVDILVQHIGNRLQQGKETEQINAQMYRLLQNELNNKNKIIDQLKQDTQNKEMEIDKLNKDVQNQQSQYETLKMTIASDEENKAMNLTKLELDEIETAVKNLQNDIKLFESKLIGNELKQLDGKLNQVSNELKEIKGDTEAIEDICNTFEKQQISAATAMKAKRETWKMYKNNNNNNNNINNNIDRRIERQENRQPLRSGRSIEAFNSNFNNNNNIVNARAKVESKENDNQNSQAIWQFGATFDNNDSDVLHSGFFETQQRGSSGGRHNRRDPKSRISRPQHQPPRTRSNTNVNNQTLKSVDNELDAVLVEEKNQEHLQMQEAIQNLDRNQIDLGTRLDDLKRDMQVFVFLFCFFLDIYLYIFSLSLFVIVGD